MIICNKNKTIGDDNDGNDWHFGINGICWIPGTKALNMVKRGNIMGDWYQVERNRLWTLPLSKYQFLQIKTQMFQINGDLVIGQWSSTSTLGSNKRRPTNLTLETSRPIASKLNQHGQNPCRFKFKADTWCHWICAITTKRKLVYCDSATLLMVNLRGFLSLRAQMT